ncbi:MAG: carbamoyltransferase C-terminal domain-containing protein [Candidatus Wallbacteria bacterium]|nr:carbamoyltransferase C-terminal domain-containing protein [Candidatus Wallbacteria bacterium]
MDTSQLKNIYLGCTYSDEEILETLQSYLDRRLAVRFLRDRAELNKVVLVYSLLEWKETQFSEQEMTYDDANGEYKAFIDLGQHRSACWRFRVHEGETIRWEDRNQRNWFVNTSSGICFSRFQDIPARTARLLADGKIVAWFQGGSEFGSRALGNRSILADPRDPQMKDKLNQRVKHREWFRPFAPSCLAEYAANYFDPPGPSPYMMTVSGVLPDKCSLIPAVVHVDGTARLQTVEKDQNPLFYSLIDEFRRITGIPMLLNTSFNHSDEPIVETPRDSLACFLNTGIDCLVMHDFLIWKKEI